MKNKSSEKHNISINSNTNNSYNNNISNPSKKSEQNKQKKFTKNIDYLLHPKFIMQKQIIINFLSEVYSDIYKRSNRIFNSYVFQELIRLPITISDKIYHYINDNKSSTIPLSQFTNGIYNLLYSDYESKIDFSFQIFDFNHDKIIHIKDVYLIMYLFHLIENRDNNLNLLKVVIDNFFDNGRDTMTQSEYCEKTKNSNSDLCILFNIFYNNYNNLLYKKELCFYQKIMKFETKNDIEYISKIKKLTAIDINNLILSKYFIEYINEIKLSENYEFIPEIEKEEEINDSQLVPNGADDDKELEDLYIFERDKIKMFSNEEITKALSSVNRNKSNDNAEKLFNKKLNIYKEKTVDENRYHFRSKRSTNNKSFHIDKNKVKYSNFHNMEKKQILSINSNSKLTSNFRPSFRDNNTSSYKSKEVSGVNNNDKTYNVNSSIANINTGRNELFTQSMNIDMKHNYNDNNELNPNTKINSKKVDEKENGAASNIIFISGRTSSKSIALKNNNFSFKCNTNQINKNTENNNVNENKNIDINNNLNQVNNKSLKSNGIFEINIRNEITNKADKTIKNKDILNLAKNNSKNNQQGILRSVTFNLFPKIKNDPYQSSPSNQSIKEMNNKITLNEEETLSFFNKYEYKVTLYKFKKNDYQTKKKIQLILINSYLFYFKKLSNTTSYIFKKIMPIIDLFPQILSITKNKYQLVLQSTFRNFLISYSFISDSRDKAEKLVNKIKERNKIKDITSDFDLGTELGHGKFGHVITGRHIYGVNPNKKYAIKIVKKIYSEEEYKINRWEIDIFLKLTNIRHQNIVKCYRKYETHKNIFFVYEYIKGSDLKNFIQCNFQQKNKINVMSIANQLINGVLFLHKLGIIHRDIKTTNIMINSEGTIKILDFGLSRIMGYEEKSNDPYGSLCYKAPELILHKPYDFKVDVWAMGVTLYYVVFNVLPFDSNDKYTLKQKIIKDNFDLSLPMCNSNFDDEFIFRIINDTLNKNPKERPDIFQVYEEYLCSDNQYCLSLAYNQKE